MCAVCAERIKQDHFALGRFGEKLPPWEWAKEGTVALVDAGLCMEVRLQE